MDVPVRRRKRAVIVVLVATAVALVALVPVVNRLLTADLAFVGIDEGATVNSDALRDAGMVAVGGRTDLSGVEVLVDGNKATARQDGDRLVLDASGLPEGPHVITARMPSSLPLLPGSEVSRRFTVDNSAPVLAVDAAPVQDLRKPFRLSGSAEGAVSMLVNDQPVPLTDGRFSHELFPVPANVRLTARDAAGNTATKDVPLQVRHPGMRGVHMTALAWASPQLREPVLQMAREGRIDTVELDIKDESGEVGYDSAVPLGREIGATRKHYDAKATVEQLHAAGVRIVGRIVAFRDPILARASWDSGKRDRVIQTSDGRPWSGSYGQYAFTNFADPEVVRYNIDLAAEAAKLGFDDILYDYVRRPEGRIEQMRIPGFTGKPEDAITAFLARSRDEVRKHGAFVGASVFGIAADRPGPVGQNIPAISRAVDYISPMVYPSHWGPGEYGVPQPESQPYDITARSVAAFVAQSRDGGAQVIPWLQAFSLRKAYGPAEVKAQIEAARQSGASSFLLWNASCRYDPAILESRP
ncbi:putative glycoside hydrolase [Kibdelosporangium persicum]|uniref:Glycoside hydrolase n=1 Tax=Kibdelosporangium persicum TaxID=2698649 RepID=A0ABX2F9J3_9PSEU|nr:putative glycoside hydrolase [Kibdelosporangium persicum]NRN67799.1 putative glycoside hydrolase [Kibdelosporangium persicum]